MAYKIIISPRAQKEIENAVDYYSLYSDDAPKHFIYSLQNAYKTLTVNPFFRIWYREIRAFKIKRFPYSLFFIIDEEQETIKILSCFHNKRNPSKTPKF
jgi:toxin ParE1/3/4